MKTKTNKTRKSTRPTKQFVAGMEQMAFLVAAGWDFSRKTESAGEALKEMRAQIATFRAEAGR